MPQINVIVPVYKVESYLTRCVDSILAQTFTDFELILVDDGSPDNCPAMCDEYAKKDSRVHVIHQQNGGLSAARNAGIDWAFANSDSQWLAFIDSDDWVHCEMLDRLYRMAVELDAQISVCGYVETHGESPEPDFSQFQPQVLEPQIFYVQNGVTAVVAWGKLYRKEYFSTLRYPVGKIHEDEFLTYLLLCQASRVAYLPAAMYYYYYNDQGITKSPFSFRDLDTLVALKDQYIFFKAHYGQSVAQALASRYIYITCLYINTLKHNSTCRHDDFDRQAVRLKKELREFFKTNPEVKCLVKTANHSLAYKIAFPFMPYVRFYMQYFKQLGCRETLRAVRRKIGRIFHKETT